MPDMHETLRTMLTGSYAFRRFNSLCAGVDKDPTDRDDAGEVEAALRALGARPSEIPDPRNLWTLRPATYSAPARAERDFDEPPEDEEIEH